jgi:DNA-binding NtrC family response regulator
MKILIIDEDLDYLKDIKRALTRFNFNININSDSAILMELLKKEIFEVLIYTVQEKLKENLIMLQKIKIGFKDLKIILITELNYFKNEKQCLCTVADALLDKPFNLKDLIEYLYKFEAVVKN